MSLRHALRSGVAAACIVGVAAPAMLGASHALAQGPLAVKTGQGRDFTHVEFRWAGGARMTSRREGQVLTVAFNRDAKPNLAELRAMPPRWVKQVESRTVNGRLEIAFTLADGADAKTGQGDGVSFVNFFKAADPPAGAAVPPPVSVAAPARPNAVPANGVVRVSAEKAGLGLNLNFDFAAPAGAAVFRRGEAIWIVFDAAARLDTSAVPASGVQYSRIEALRGPGYSALRIVAPQATLAMAQAQGARWSVTLGSRSDGRFDAISLGRDETSNPPALTAVVAGASQPVWVQDTAVGDRLAVIPALGPAKGLPARRTYVDVAVLASSHGLAAEPRTPDLAVQVQGDLVQIGRPSGLALSPASAQTLADAQGAGNLAPAPLPGLISPDWAKTAPQGFLKQYDALMAAASVETAQASPGAPAPNKARMQLARFLIGHDLAFEAIGVLNAAARADQTLMGEAEFRGLRGAARVIAGRYKEAESDLSVPVLSDDPSSALWRGLIAARAGQWEDARAKFVQGQRAMAEFSPYWQSRFARSDANAALSLGDYVAANASMAIALQQAVSPEEQLETRLIQAELFRAMGDKARALAMFEAIARAPVEKVAAPALLQASQLKLETGKMTPNQAAAVYSEVRFRWRGDATELETIRALGQLYLSQGRYREGLEALRSAGQRLPDLPEAVLLQNDLYGAFRSLFLEGLADGLQPIQALALFYDFKDMTPIGVEGDQMVRNLVRRLVDVDLLDQAAELLKYQVDNRLDGIPKAQVATDLAMIYLMARKPEQALQTINESRSTLLPNALNAERRLVTARALVSLGRLDAAVEMIEADRSREAQDIRAEAAWKGKTWPQAGALYEAALGERWKSSSILAADEEGKLLRAGVAYSLADDDEGLARLRGRYQGFVDASRNPEALRVALAGVGEGLIGRADFSRTTADTQTFAGWVTKMKQRFREKPAPVGPAPTRQAAVPAAKG
jgi:tetratricopeptide (TPR) repeat protein